jgi:GNAT superfamily N-acetyltransferase
MIMEVRFAKYNDFEGIMNLYEFLHPGDTLAPLNQLKNIWDEVMNDTRKYQYVVAEEDNRILATSCITIIPNLTRKARPYAVIENMVTHPDVRRRGIGRATMKLLLEFAKQNDCYKVMLLSSNNRKTSHNFYYSMGFDGDVKRGFTYYIV